MAQAPFHLIFTFCDGALIARGSITLRVDEEVLGGWRARSGGGRPYGDVAILAALGLRAVFGLTLRRTQRP